MTTIDFDARFRKHTETWMQRNAGQYRNLAEMEAQMPEVYFTWLKTPAPWLEGVSPGAYFQQGQSAAELVELMLSYLSGRVPLPDPLLEAIALRGEEATAPLLAILRGGGPTEPKMIAVSLLTEIDTPAPLELYVQTLCDEGASTELRERIAEALQGMGAASAPACLSALASASDDAAELLLSVLCEFPGQGAVLARLMELFSLYPERRALLASYLAKYGDPAALPALQEAIASAEGYIDFLELRNAIEALGGDAVADRDFSGDADFEVLHRLEGDS